MNGPIIIYFLVIFVSFFIGVIVALLAARTDSKDRGRSYVILVIISIVSFLIGTVLVLFGLYAYYRHMTEKGTNDSSNKEDKNVKSDEKQNNIKFTCQKQLIQNTNNYLQKLKTHKKY